MPPKKAAATGAIGEPKKSTRPSRAVTAPKAEAAPAPAPKKATPKKAAAGTTKKAPVATTKKAVASKRTTTKKTAASAAESDKENQGVSKKKATAPKRKRDEEEDDAAAPASSSEEESEQPTKDADGDIVMTDEPKATKRRRVEEAQAMPRLAKRIARPLAVINKVPTQILDVFVFGEGTAGELGLGSVRVDGKKPIDVKRPRLNHNLKGVVQVACGGMHVAVLTSENKILTWGVNDQGALGRDTTWDGGLRDVDAEEDSDDEDDTGMNPKESTPAEIDTSELPEDIKWVQVVASDSATFALTTTGQVYGWGTFRSNEGVLGFSRTVGVQKTPALIPEVSKITQLAAGLNHILALDNKNKIFAWGAGQQAQLARRLLERDDLAALYPTGIGALPGRARAVKLACGSYHSFVIDSKGRVISWGLNNYAECGHDDEVGVDGGYVMRPRVVESLKDHVVTDIAGGEHHSLACTSDGKLLTWGRIDGNQVGQPAGSFSEDNTVYDDRHLPRILVVPTEIASVKDAVQVAAGTDHSFAVTKEGKVYSWGFSANYQTGQGTTDDIKEPEVIDNTAIRNRKIVYAGGGGQYGIVAAVHEED